MPLSPITVKNITNCTKLVHKLYSQTLTTQGCVSDFTKTSPHVLNPELFALHLGTFFVSKYPHIHKAFITIEKLRWSRIAIKSEDGSKASDHPHAFVRDGDDKRVIEVEVSWIHT
jgi:urate oxidase